MIFSGGLKAKHRWDGAVSPYERALQLSQFPRCIWFTGLSGSGKSTLAVALERFLLDTGHHTFLLDADELRRGLNCDLGFSDEDRIENIRRASAVAKLMVDAGLIVIVAMISPFQKERAKARALFANEKFIEVFVDTPLAVCEQRDPKNLYAKARRGELANFTGIDSSYEQPIHCDVCVNTALMSIPECIERIVLSKSMFPDIE